MNSSLYDNTYELPANLIGLLSNNIKKYDSNTDGYKRANNIVNDNGNISYSNVKKILSFLDNFNPIKDDKNEFDILGGHEMKNWCKRTLNNDRVTDNNRKKAQDLTSNSNPYRKEHDKTYHNPQKAYSNVSQLTEMIKEEVELEPINAASVGIVINDKKEYLLLKRSGTDDWMPNKWSLVGGGVDEGETPKEAFIHEVKEESGLSLDDVEYSYSKIENEFYVHFFVAKTSDTNVKISFEHSEYAWVKPEDISKYDKVPNLGEDMLKALQEFKD